MRIIWFLLIYQYGAKNLNKLESSLVNNAHPKPSFKMILTGCQHVYKRDDGAIVVPLGCLRV